MTSMPCAGNLRKAWAALFALAKHAGGRSGIARAMRLCGGENSLKNEADVMALALWAESAWDYMAMVRDPSQAPNQYQSVSVLDSGGVTSADAGAVGGFRPRERER